MKLIILLILNYFLLSSNTTAQEIHPHILSSAGNLNQSTTMSIEWTLGELSITTISGPSTMITQGFHQPRLVVTAIYETIENFGKLNVYPNPTSDQVTLNMEFDKKIAVQVDLTDSQGRKIIKRLYFGQNVNDIVSLRDLPNGTYFVSFSFDNNYFKKSFKILKTK